MSLEFHVYVQRDRHRPQVDRSRCRIRVYDRWRIDVVGRKCCNKAVVRVDGYGLCRQHAKQYKPKEGI